VISISKPSGRCLSLTPGFSPVDQTRTTRNRFNGFSTRSAKPLKRFWFSLSVGTGLKPGVIGGGRASARRVAVRFLTVVVSLFCLSTQSQPADTNTESVRFRAVDIYLDSKGKPLAAYQLEFSVTNGNAKIVGIEGGEHPAFTEPPFYDAKAMQHERVILAAFSTEASDKLPSGKTRVATIHLQLSAASEPEFELKLQTAAEGNGNKITADANADERNRK